MDTAHITEILTDTVTLDLVKKQPITQIAHAALNGSPRAFPLGYLLVRARRYIDCHQYPVVHFSIHPFTGLLARIEAVAFPGTGVAWSGTLRIRVRP
jgi:hypothetical protein